MTRYMSIPVKICDLVSGSAPNYWNIHTGDRGESLACGRRRKHNLHMHKRHPVVGGPENLRSDLMEVSCGQYFRTGGAAVYQMFYDTAEETRAIWMAQLANDATSDRSDSQAKQGSAKKRQAEQQEGQGVITSLSIRYPSQTRQGLSENVQCNFLMRMRLD